jgi:hypothetical protein
MTDFKTFFERCYVVSLHRRPDRYQEFMARMKDWPFAPIQRWEAVDGKLVPHPQWWRNGGGAWGCLRSHAQIIERCLNEEVGSVLLLEDDAMPCDGFVERVRRFLQEVPADWEMLYLGGQHLCVPRHPPERVNDYVIRPYNVNRTHAFALNQNGMRIVEKHLYANDWHVRHHIDHHLGRLHQSKRIVVYCPTVPDQPWSWLIGQARGKSNISGNVAEDRFWKLPESASQRHTSEEERPNKKKPMRFLAIVGLHSSGSSAIAGVCHHLGVHLGNHLIGFYGNNPSKLCGFEAKGLMKICEKAARFPLCKFTMPATILRAKLQDWIVGRQKEARKRNSLAGGKYPHLCQMGDLLQQICGNGLLVLDCDRPLEDSIASLQRREKKRSSEKIEAVQQWLWDGKQQLLAAIPSERKLSVSYKSLLASPVEEVARITTFLGVTPTQAQIDAAIAYVKPELQHVGKEAT